MAFSAISWATGTSGNPDIFTSSSTRSSDLSAFAKWTKAVEHSQKKQKNTCNDAFCPSQDWAQLIARGKQSGRSLETLKTINQALNKHEYVLDIVNWGQPDFWASPLQFALKNGDCEDYAIAKYMALKHVGFPASSMRIVIVQDENLHVIHAVLAVRLNQTNYILDNQVDQVISDTNIVHYRPVYSINEQYWWRHFPATKKHPN